MSDTDLVISLSALGVAPGALLLDLGCGTGTPARALARAGFRVVGVDADVDAVETAHARIRMEGDDAAAGDISPAYLAARAADLPFSAATFDAVVCLDVFHWSADEAAFRAVWDEAWRALRPGGVLLARCLMCDEFPRAGLSAVAPPARGGAGRYRLASGAEWFLPSRALLDDVVARGAGTLVESPRSAGTPGSARFAVRKAA